MFELSTLADCREELMRRFFDQLKRRDSYLRHLMPTKRELSLITVYDTHVYMNFRKRELLDTQNLLFLIVFSILRKAPNDTYIYSIHYLSF